MYSTHAVLPAMWGRVQAAPHLLHLTVASNRVDAADMLLSMGIQVDALDDKVRLSLLIDIHSGAQAQCFLYLRTQGMTPLMYACVCGHLDMARCLLLHGANLSSTNHQTVGQDWVTPQYQDKSQLARIPCWCCLPA